MKKAIVTGATGFVGRHLTEFLCEHGIEVFAVIRDKHKADLLPENAVCVFDDLSDTEMLTQKLSGVGAEGADVFYHLAWNGVARRYKNDFLCQYTNISTSLNAIKACNYLRCGKFVYSGTVAEYVTNEGLICPDSTPTPNDIYGSFKVAARFVLSAYAKSVDQPWVSTILSSAYGEYRRDGSVIPYTIEALLRGETPSFGELDQMWGFIYAKDAANAFYLIGEKGINNKTYPIGTSERRPLREYIYKIRDCIDPALPLNVGVHKEFKKVQSSCVDITELENDVGFKPRYNFDEGIINTIEWYKKAVALDILPGQSR